MRRVAATLITIAMTTSGCATYEGARTARNAGIVMGVAGLAALGVGLALSQNSELTGGCPSGGGGGNNCDGVSGGGGIFLTMAGVGLLGYGLVFGLVGSQGMEKHSPEAERRVQERAEQERIDSERIAREQREAAAREREAAARDRELELARQRAERDKAQRRDQAFVLLKSAVEAARANRCGPVNEIEEQVLELDANVHDAWFVRDPDIKRCLAAPPPTTTTPPPTTTMPPLIEP